METGRITYADLMECRNMANMIEDKTEQLQRLESQIEKITTSIRQTGGIHGGPNDGMTDKIAALLDMRDALWDAILDQKAKCDYIRIQIGILPFEQIRVIELRYFDGLQWDDIATRMHYERRQCFRLHKCALKNLGIFKPCH